MSDNPKNTLRTEALRHRGRMHYDIEDTDKALTHLMQSIKPQAGQVIASYWPMDNEFDTHPIMEALIDGGSICALPCVQKGSRVLEFKEWNAQTPMKQGAYEIMEPDTQDTVTPDIVLVPLLAFDRKGNRLGYGGGYYDATLRALRSQKPITAIGLAYAQQACLFNLPAEDHDEPLDWVITPQGAQRFGEV